MLAFSRIQKRICISIISMPINSALEKRIQIGAGYAQFFKYANDFFCILENTCMQCKILFFYHFLKLSPRSQMFIIIIFITITQQPEQDRWAENQPTAGLSSLNEYENEYENGMRRSRTELLCVILAMTHSFMYSHITPYTHLFYVVGSSH